MDPVGDYRTLLGSKVVDNYEDGECACAHVCVHTCMYVWYAYVYLYEHLWRYCVFHKDLQVKSILTTPGYCTTALIFPYYQ